MPETLVIAPRPCILRLGQDDGPSSVTRGLDEVKKCNSQGAIAPPQTAFFHFTRPKPDIPGLGISKWFDVSALRLNRAWPITSKPIGDGWQALTQQDPR
ncbi:hypothetical protein DYH55_22950 [Methylovirgula sp. 4M-Z18]|nr:hypothetical protein DYH55_22950 [Methylovirgula sp. 4M-Z18]